MTRAHRLIIRRAHRAVTRWHHPRPYCRYRCLRCGRRLVRGLCRRCGEG